jgi:hypothetical protein
MFPATAGGKDGHDESNGAITTSKVDRVSKLYVLGYSLIKLSYALTILGGNGLSAGTPPLFSVWWLHIILTLCCVIIPITSLLVNNEKSWLMVTGVVSIGLSMELLRGLTQSVCFPVAVIVLDAIAAILSLRLAVENVALQVAATRLNME